MFPGNVIFILELPALARIYRMVGAPRGGYYLGDMILEEYPFLGGNSEINTTSSYGIALFPYFLVSLFLSLW